MTVSEKLAELLNGQVPDVPGALDADAPRDQAGVQTWISERMRVLRGMYARIAVLTASMDAELQHTADFYDAKIGTQRRAIEYLEGVLAPVVAEAIKHQKAKSIDTPHGRTGYRSVAPQVLWPDNEAMLTMLREAQAPAKAIRHKEEPALDWIRKHMGLTSKGKVVLIDGERTIPLDVSTLPGHQQFYVQTEDE